MDVNIARDNVEAQSDADILGDAYEERNALATKESMSGTGSIEIQHTMVFSLLR